MGQAENGTNLEIPSMCVVPDPYRMPDELVEKITNVGALRYSVQLSGRDDYEIADAIGISHGYMSKVLKGTASLGERRLVKFMRETNSIAPLQRLGYEMGCEVRVVNVALRKIDALERALADARARVLQA